ncbi:membrane protein [Lentzea sp. NBRC 105346]|uniref:FtsX-like permease family protein n=1 Tax=Lentzea sp. NBRC 105346 TaxID=3032205 RepID=UPI0024A1BC0D|nr:FtsX-like permease family protein [Lentzea sp. NBRC 105346]GLZ31610.1 membrane protein [Lentzea sp. NBRC 105346]
MFTSLRLGLAEFRARPGRALLPGAALIVGVACLLASLVLSDALSKAVEEGAPTTPSTVDHVVTVAPRAEAKLDDAVVTRLSGVARAVAVQRGEADLLDANGRAGEHRAEVDVELPDLRRVPIAEGHGPAADGEVAVDKLTAYNRGLRPGDHIRLADKSGRPIDVLVSGITKRGGLDSRPVLVAGPDLVHRLDPEPSTREIWVIGGQRGAVETAAGTGFDVSAPSPDADSIGNDMTTLLLPFSILALATAVFVASATFRAVYAQRQRQTALLRCLGAQRGPLVRRNLVEALLTGAFAGVLGALLAGPTAWVLARTFDVTGISGLFGAVKLSPDLLPNVGYIVLGVCVAAALSAMSAVRPAIGAARVSPLAALRTSDNEVPSLSVRRLRMAFGIVVTGFAGLLAFGAVAAKGSTGAFFFAVFSAIFAVTGLFWILGPVTVPFVARLFGRIGGTHWKLAAAEVRRMPQRAASVALPLLLASSMVTFFVVVLGTAQNLTDDFANQARPDVTVVDAGSRPLPAIPGAPGVAASVAVHQNDDHVYGVDPARFNEWLKAQHLGAVDGFGPGTALAHERSGSSVTVGGKSFRVVGAIPDGIGYPSAVVADESIGPVKQVFAALQPGTDPAAYRSAIHSALSNAPTVVVRTAADERAEADRYLHLGTVLMMVLLGLSVAVAVTGIGTALTISVQERRKELALRRALGVTRGGLQGGVVAEAVLLALVGVLAGGALGFAYAQLTLVATGAFDDASPLPGFRVLLPLLIGGAIVVTLAVVAAFGPSRTASRIRPAAGLASG